MNENVIEFIRGEETATVTFSQGRFVNKVRKLAEKYPDECRIVFENADGSIVAHIPVKWIHLNKHVGRELTEEEINAGTERLKAYREQRRYS